MSTLEVTPQDGPGAGSWQLVLACAMLWDTESEQQTANTLLL